MKQEVKNFILKYNALIGGLETFIDHKIYDYDLAYNNDGNFIDYIGGLYKYGGCERGKCEVIFESTNLEDCMYFPIRTAIHKLAFEFELRNRLKNIDSRVIGFGMMINYMDKLQKKEWSQKLYKELKLIIDTDGLDERKIIKIFNSGEI